MSKILVINIIKDDKEIASIYYHWGAWSLRTLQETKIIIDHLEYEEYQNKTTKEIQLSLIHLAQSLGGCINNGLTSEEGQKIQKIFPNESFSNDGFRNNGLIAITPEGIRELQKCPEGEVCINLDLGVITNNVWLDIDDGELDFTPIKIDINPEEFLFEDIDALISIIEDYHYFKYQDIIYEAIEE